MGVAGLEGEGEGTEEFFDAGGPTDAEVFVFVGEDEAIAVGAFDEDGGATEEAGFEDGAVLGVAFAGEAGVGEEGEGFAEEGEAEVAGGEGLGGGRWGGGHGDRDGLLFYFYKVARSGTNALDAV